MLGKLESVSIGTPAITPDVVISGNVTIGGEVAEIFGQSAFPIVTVGNMDVNFSFVTTDPTVLALVQSQVVETITFTYKGVATAINPSTFALTADSDQMVYVLSAGYVVDVIEVAADNTSKNAIQYTVTIKACMLDGDEPTITKTFTAGA